jgi:hypothetical protein
MDVTQQKTRVVDNKELLLIALARFYNNKNFVKTIVPIIKGTSTISLRLIDWFVTNYSKKHAAIITQNNGDNVVHFNVYLNYRSQLKSYSKQLFDPFRRRDRIMFYFDKITCIETTIGQLNFFRWLIQNDIIGYIEKHMEVIEDDMLKTQKENSMKKSLDENMNIKITTSESGETIIQKRKKRSELSKSFIQHMNTVQGKHKIMFD